MKLNLSKVSDVKAFVTLSQSCVGELTLKSLDNRYAVDAKSILGIFSLDLSQPVELVGSQEDLNKFSLFQI